MICGIGVDIIEINRIEKAMKRSSCFLDKIFTYEEIEFYKKKGYKPESIAGGFASKEAVSKALGTGFSGFSIKEIVITRNENGKPSAALCGKAKEKAEELVGGNGEYILHLTISHSDSNAVAYAILEVK